EWRDKYSDPRHLPAVRMWVSQVGEYADDLLALLPGLDVSRFPFSVFPLPKVVAAIRAAKDPPTVKALAVKGEGLLAARGRPGPDVGETLERLLAEVLEDPSRNTRDDRSEEHTSELQSRSDLVCRLLLEKKNMDDSRNAYTPVSASARTWACVMPATYSTTN